MFTGWPLNVRFFFWLCLRGKFVIVKKPAARVLTYQQRIVSEEEAEKTFSGPFFLCKQASHRDGCLRNCV